MPRSMPPLGWFRAFEAAARRLSFTGAAEELGMTQSAVSQHVRSLEQRFGVTLFTRNARGITLTDEGRRLIPEVSRAIETLASVSSAYDTRAGRPALTIAASISITQWYLAPGLPEFRKRFPDLSVRIVNTTWPDEYRSARADIEIRFGSASLVGKGAERLGPDEAAIIAHPDIQDKADVLQNHPLIQAVGTSETWRRWQQKTKAEGIPEPQLFVDSHGLAVDLVRRGAGIALTSSLIAAPLLKAGEVQRLDFPALPATDGYYLALTAPENETAVAFHDWLLDRVAYFSG